MSRPLPPCAGEGARSAFGGLFTEDAFARFAAFTDELQPHFAYGQLDHAEYAGAHVLHLYNHLTQIETVPAES